MRLVFILAAGAQGVTMKIFLLVAMLMVLPMQAEAQLLDGNKLATVVRAYEKSAAGQALTSEEWFQAGLYQGFVIAAHDAYESAGEICKPDSVLLRQVGAVVAAYLDSHPTDWNFSAISLVQAALKEAFPCG